MNLFSFTDAGSTIGSTIMRSGVNRLLIGCCLLFAAGCNLGVQQHNVSGSQAYRSGQYAQAINQFQQALQANPRDSNAYYNLAASYYSMGKQSKNSQWLQQAEQLYRQSISLNDQHVDAHRGLSALLIETGREKFAFDLLNDWKARYPNSAQPTIELARVYQEYGDNRRATDLLADALRLDGGNVRALKAMGHVREVQGQTNLALDNYLRVLQIDPQQGEVAQRVATLQSQLGQSSAGTVPARYGSANPYIPR
jgi:tetratricopeptide (TPR) repeat protein